MHRFVALCLLSCAAAVHAAAPIYDEGADARADIAAALVQAQKASVPVLVVFGANWCGDCQVLDMALRSGSSAPLIQSQFRLVHVNVGRFDRNVELAASYAVPLKQGIPAVAVLSPAGKLLYATKAGELADARHMGEQGIYAFFEKVARQQP